MEAFDAVLGERPNQIEQHARRRRGHAPAQLLDVAVPGGEITEEGLRNNVARRHSSTSRSWLGGDGAAAINNLMEDAATAEISRSQVWQWLHHDRIERAEVERVLDEEAASLDGAPNVDRAVALFRRVALGDELEEFLTLPAYELLVEGG